MCLTLLETLSVRISMWLVFYLQKGTPHQKFICMYVTDTNAEWTHLHAKENHSSAFFFMHLFHVHKQRDDLRNALMSAGCKYTCHAACRDRVSLDCHPSASPVSQDHLNNNTLLHVSTPLCACPFSCPRIVWSTRVLYEEWCSLEHKGDWSVIFGTFAGK